MLRRHQRDLAASSGKPRGNQWLNGQPEPLGLVCFISRLHFKVPAGLPCLRAVSQNEMPVPKNVTVMPVVLVSKHGSIKPIQF